MFSDVYDISRLNIGVLGAHSSGFAHPNELMNSSIGDSTRRPVTNYPSASYLGRAYSYDVLSRYMDANHTGSESGSANEPWTSFNAVNSNESNRHIFVTSGTYIETGTSFIANNPNIFEPIRGGTIVIDVQAP